MYNFDTYDTTSSAVSDTGIAAFLGASSFITLAGSIFMIVCMWKIFKKAGKNGWESIIPIYNIIVMLQIINLPTWYIILFIVPFVNIYVAIKMCLELAKKFGKDTAFGILMIFFPYVCYPILAFGNSTYEGTSQENNQTQDTQMNGNINQNVNPNVGVNSMMPNNNNFNNTITDSTVVGTNATAQNNSNINPVILNNSNVNSNIVNNNINNNIDSNSNNVN